MEHLDKLDVLLRAGCGGEGVLKTVRHVRDQIHRECAARHYNVTGVVRRTIVKSWYASLCYLLNEDSNRVYIGQSRSDWTAQATDLRDHSQKLLHGRRMQMEIQYELATALSGLADLIDYLEKIYDGVAGPWGPLLAAVEARRDQLSSPVGTSARPDDDTNVHLVLKAHEVRAILGVAPSGSLVPPVDRVYKPVRTPGQGLQEYGTGYAYVTPEDRIQAVVYDPPASLETIKDSVRAAGCRLFEVEVRLTEEVDLTPPKSRDDVLREAALAALPTDVAEELLRRAGLPPF